MFEEQESAVVAATRMRGITYSLDFHTHKEYELVLLHGGNCRFLVGNQFFYLQPGQLLMLDGMTIHKAYVSGDPQDYERSVLRFDSDWIRPLLQDINLERLLNLFEENSSGLIRIFKKRDEAIIENMIGEIATLVDLEENRLNEARLKLAVVQLLIHISISTDYIIRKDQGFRDEKTEIAEKVSNFLFKNYHRSISIDDVSQAVNISKSYMSHVFKEVTGHTIMTYLMQYRLSKARSQITQEPNQLIKVISQENGFESEAHFSRFFKKNIGLSPSQYKKQYYQFISGGEFK
ncbi:AraC family transcriptional regulator [Jeotgalibaca arthritidis]|uniref:AraC family transcriptional regulator n=1 Tax=Jeotgalibaca arthritidis TaxID=1868794 RepID=A0A6G7KCQ9_9LACT|nr:AraC family transcriptional regulator [Jeotgalibaca arthritidis]QII83053.1 AraC family transcriptional regulator [Jeotgalibaca arthritidis]